MSKLICNPEFEKDQIELTMVFINKVDNLYLSKYNVYIKGKFNQWQQCLI